MKFKAKTLEDIAVHLAEMSDDNVKLYTELGGGSGRKHPTKEMTECKARAEALAEAAQIVRNTELEGEPPRRRRKATAPSGDAQ